MTEYTKEEIIEEVKRVEQLLYSFVCKPFNLVSHKPILNDIVDDGFKEAMTYYGMLIHIKKNENPTFEIKVDLDRIILRFLLEDKATSNVMLANRKIVKSPEYISGINFFYKGCVFYARIGYDTEYDCIYINFWLHYK